MNWGRKTEPKPSYRLGSIEIGEPWARVPGPGAGEMTDGPRVGGYLTLANKGPTPDRLVGATSPDAASVEIHAIKVVGSDIKMRRLEKGLAIPASTTFTLKPRGYHLLLKEPRAGLVPGMTVAVTLAFEAAGKLEIELPIKDAGPIGNVVLLQPA